MDGVKKNYIFRNNNSMNFFTIYRWRQNYILGVTSNIPKSILSLYKHIWLSQNQILWTFRWWKIYL